MEVSNDRKATPRAKYTSAVNQDVNRLDVNVLDDIHPLINNSEKDLTRKESTTPTQLRSGHCRLLRSYKSRINNDASLNVCADCGRTHVMISISSIARVIQRQWHCRIYGADQWTPSWNSAISKQEDQNWRQTTTTTIPEDLWHNPVESFREFSYQDDRNFEWFHNGLDHDKQQQHHQIWYK